MNVHVENLLELAELTERPSVRRRLQEAAEYIERADRLANHCREKVNIQIALRVEAQARAGRLAKDSRR